MTDKIESIPPGQEGLIPHLVFDDCTSALAFYKKAFDAVEVCRLLAPDGKRIMHAAMTINGHFFYMADDYPEYCGGKESTPKALGGTPVTIHRYVEDVDSAFLKAVDAGAEAKMPPADMFWGDRYGVLIDPFGHTWSLSTRIHQPTPEQMNEAMKAMFANNQG